MEDHPSDWNDGAGRLVALAERRAAEGQMNLNKLLEAVLYAGTRRTGWRYQPAVTRETIQRELAVAIAQLKEEDVAPHAGRRARSRAGAAGRRPLRTREEFDREVRRYVYDATMRRGCPPWQRPRVPCAFPSRMSGMPSSAWLPVGFSCSSLAPAKS
jgi:hypothetical protein